MLDQSTYATDPLLAPSPEQMLQEAKAGEAGSYPTDEHNLSGADTHARVQQQVLVMISQ